ncbi:hypothetical protein CUPL110328_23920 [Cupriavidus plantarum]|uniref:Uncharacterized protein n=1 Tax=Cupriavidus plantarum TaxID=942865 RepID=A0A316ERD3_9BURK|nr:hypothetical protein C7419_1031 [Cupriavidus plantarum]CAG2148861.1 hypothetical protein LMG26296_04428 [Cupriavidus plantarum]SMR85250.1 hypothetical protein SAMN05421735_4050 [Cupriavidus plantarum]
MNSPGNLKKILKRLIVGYLSLTYLVLVAAGFSLAQGAGWRPLIAGLPVFLTFFVAITYYFVRDLRAQRRRDRGESEPPPRTGPWEEE